MLTRKVGSVGSIIVVHDHSWHDITIAHKNVGARRNDVIISCEYKCCASEGITKEAGVSSCRSLTWSRLTLRQTSSA